MTVRGGSALAGALFGQPLERREDAKLLTGAGCFTDDVDLPGMVHATILRSPMAHARIVSIDIEEARAAPGVIAVITAADTGMLPPIPVRLAQLPGLFPKFSQFPLAGDRVRYVGEPVAVVVAEDRYFAEDAAELIQVDYEALPVLVSAEEATRDAVLIHPELGTNVASRYTVSHGDVDAAFAAAAYRRKEHFRCQRHTALPMETRGIVAHWDEAVDLLHIWGAAKVPFSTRRMLAEMLAIPVDSIDMIGHDIGGAFGVRGEFYSEDVLIPLLARKLRRPVKWIEDRREHLMATNHAREMECELEIAVDAQGKILAFRGDLLVNMGAYSRPNGGVAPSRAAQTMPGPYKVQNFECRVTAVMTNKTPAASYRGPGRYEANFFRERLMDMAAADLRIDPADFRLRNLLRAADMPFSLGALVPYMKAPVIYDTGDHVETMQAALDAIDYPALRKLSGKLIDGKLHGVGIGCYAASNGGGPSEFAKIIVSGSGTEVHVGASPSGQGHETTMAQLVAHQLGLDYERVTMVNGGTRYLENGNGSWHSRSLLMGGSALKLASDKIKEQALALAAERMAVGRQALEYRNGAVFLIGEEEPSLSLEEIAAEAGSLEADATFVTDDLTFSYGAQIAHVAVDPGTLQVEVLRFLVVEDLGTVLNPLVVHGQAIGGTVQGMGSALLDELVYDDMGQLLTGSLADYLTPTSTEFPRVEAITLENHPTPQNLIGSKGAAEGGIGGPGAALANAVADALRPLGVTIRDLPLSPARLYGALSDAA